MRESRADLTLKQTRRRLWHELLLDYLLPKHFSFPLKVQVTRLTGAQSEPEATSTDQSG